MMLMLVLTLACSAGGPGNETLSRQDPIPTPDRSRIQVIDDETPVGLTDADAISAYRQGYAHMRAAAWFSTIAAYDEAIRIQPAVAGLYEARGAAYMYAGRHDQALADYSAAIELNPNDAGHWRRRAHAFTIAPTPLNRKGELRTRPEPSSSIPHTRWATPTAPSPTAGYRRRNWARPLAT